MLDLISSDVVAHGTKLHYYRTGSGKTPLVLVHGITDDGLCWGPVAQVLAEKFDVVMLDMRGHGKSEAPQDGYTLENLATELAHVCMALELDRPLILGHSMGAISTLLLAGLFPDLARGILLEDPPAFWRREESAAHSAEFRVSLTEWILSNKRKTRDDLLAEVRANNAGWSQAELEPWVNSKHRYDAKVAALVQPQDIASIDFPQLMRRVRCPALFIRADVERGAICSEADVASLQAYIPQLQVAHIAGAGHSIRREQFERYVQVVQQACEGFQTG